MRILIAGWLMLLAGMAQAFDAPRHAQVCEMAYAQLSDAARQRLDERLQGSPEPHFARGCSWPDRVRDDARYQHTRPWHFVNVARSATTVSARDCPAQGCLLSAIPQMQARLQRDPDDWQALLWLAHLLTDLHQPMHVSYADDRGGNRTRVRLMGDNTNLHHLFDGDLFGRSRAVPASITPAQRQQWQQGDVPDWATESLQLTRSIYAALPASHTVDAAFRATFVPQLERQLQKASVRLALMLEQALGQAPPP